MGFDTDGHYVYVGGKSYLNNETIKPFKGSEYFLMCSNSLIANLKGKYQNIVIHTIFASLQNGS